jgi:hypothetical protein
MKEPWSLVASDGEAKASAVINGYAKRKIWGATPRAERLYGGLRRNLMRYFGVKNEGMPEANTPIAHRPCFIPHLIMDILACHDRFGLVLVLLFPEATLNTIFAFLQNSGALFLAIPLHLKYTFLCAYI